MLLIATATNHSDKNFTTINKVQHVAVVMDADVESKLTSRRLRPQVRLSHDSFDSQDSWWPRKKKQ